MHGEALSPRQIDEIFLSPEGYATQIFKTNERVAGCRLQTQDNEVAKDIIALVRKCGRFRANRIWMWTKFFAPSRLGQMGCYFRATRSKRHRRSEFQPTTQSSKSSPCQRLAQPLLSWTQPR